LRVGGMRKVVDVGLDIGGGVGLLVWLNDGLGVCDNAGVDVELVVDCADAVAGPRGAGVVIQDDDRTLGSVGERRNTAHRRGSTIRARITRREGCGSCRRARSLVVSRS
jgi:hypothetical protein